MKAISSGNTYEIFDDSLQVFDKLPTCAYIVRFNKNRGFFSKSMLTLKSPRTKYTVFI